MTKFHGNWNYPTSIQFGAGCLQHIKKALSDLGIHNPLIITDPKLADMRIFDKLLAYLSGLSFTVFCDLKPNPIKKNILEGAEVLRNNHCDGVIAFGGGSAIDSAKTIALFAHQSGDLWDYEDVGDNFKRADSSKIVPCIAIPTTSGTGSEVGRAALIIDEDKKAKRFIFHPDLTPNLVIADPELTIGLPPALTAATGMDALAHNLEAYCAKGFHPLADGIAMEGMRLIKEWLPLAVKDGENIEARSQLMAASIMGGTAFQKGLGAVHALSHPVGAIYDLHHGLLNAIFMPYVLAFNKPAIHERLLRLAKFLNLTDGNAVVNWLCELNHQFNIPMDLASQKVDESHVDHIIAEAMQDPSNSGNPRDCGIEDYRELFMDALYGKVRSHA